MIPVNITPEVGERQDRYTWSVVYQDGAALAEYDEESPQGRGWADVAEKGGRVEHIILQGAGTVYSVCVPTEMEPVFFRRRTVELMIAQEKISSIGTVHCIGWHSRQGAPAQGQAYLFVFEDGSSYLSDDLQSV